MLLEADTSGLGDSSVQRGAGGPRSGCPRWPWLEGVVQRVPCGVSQATPGGTERTEPGLWMAVSCPTCPLPSSDTRAVSMLPPSSFPSLVLEAQAQRQVGSSSRLLFSLHRDQVALPCGTVPRRVPTHPVTHTFWGAEASSLSPCPPEQLHVLQEQSLPSSLPPGLCSLCLLRSEQWAKSL